MAGGKVQRKKKTPDLFEEDLRGVKQRTLEDTIIQQVVEFARQKGLPIYLVGGAIRDIILGRRVTDYDFVVEDATTAFLDQLGNLLEASVAELWGRIFILD